MTILDTNRNTVGHLTRLKRLGVKTIIRYIAAGLTRNEKVVKPGEASAIGAAGMKLGLVYEIGGKPNGTYVGRRDGDFALQYAKTVGAPRDAVIWYAVDYDATASQMPGIMAAFAAFKDSLGGYYRVGAYASGFVCDRLYGAGLISHRWLTMSMGFNGTRAAYAAGRWELLQRLEKMQAGLDTDPDVARVDKNGNDVDIGDFTPDLPDPSEVVGSVAWQQRVLNELDQAGLDVDGVMGPMTIRAIENFQRKHDLDVDGVVGRHTIAVIENLLAGMA
jgi:Rv2525c-like, glycoside hydrolase-like domain/Putative peptidoglycan binding domain